MVSGDDGGVARLAAAWILLSLPLCSWGLNLKSIRTKEESWGLQTHVPGPDASHGQPLTPCKLLTYLAKYNWTCALVMFGGCAVAKNNYL